MLFNKAIDKNRWLLYFDRPDKGVDKIDKERRGRLQNIQTSRCSSNSGINLVGDGTLWEKLRRVWGIVETVSEGEKKVNGKANHK